MLLRKVTFYWNYGQFEDDTVIYCNNCEQVFSYNEYHSCIGMWDKKGISNICPECNEGKLCHFLPEWNILYS